jgi:hypothetical protein
MGVRVEGINARGRVKQWDAIKDEEREKKERGKKGRKSKNE